MSSSSSIKISSIAAFSYHWNKGIDSKDPCFIRLGKSIAVFFKTLFFDYPVSEVDAKAFLHGNGGNHSDSLFIKECNKKFENFTIEIVSGNIERVNEPTNGAQKYYDKDLKTQSNELTETDKASVENISVDELEELMKSKDFKDDPKYLSEDKLKLLKKEDCLRLFDTALFRGHSKIALLLLLTKKCDESPNLLNKGNRAALPFFIERGIERGVEYLLNNNLVDVNARNFKFDTPIVIAVEAGQEKCLKMLLDKGATLNDFNPLHSNPLHSAAQTSHTGCLDMLLKAGANINHASDNGVTALHCAAQGHTECLKVLVGAGANLNDANRHGDTALHYAVWAQNEACIRVLVNAGAEINNLTLHDRLSPLHMAAHRDVEAVNVLLDAPGINVNVRSRNGETPLHIAIKRYQRSCVMALLNKEGIDLKVMDNNGSTPLDIAVQQNDTPLIKQLRLRISSTENLDNDDQNNSDKQESS